ncbi:MAG TPA: hypothetical protein VIV60_00555, partial [Polyangiaceae bacterium]
MRSNVGDSGLDPSPLRLVVTSVTNPTRKDARSGESDVNSSFDECAGSAVMPAAMVVVDLDWLLDELELRLTRCVYDTPALAIGRRVGPSLAAGESLHRAAESETQAWWDEHGLAEADGRVQVKIVTVLLERSPQFLAWGAVPLLTKYLTHPLELEFVEQLVGWVTEPDPADRMIRDA